MRVKLQGSVGYGWRIARVDRVARAVRFLQPIGPIKRRLVTANAARRAIYRNTVVKEQHTTQFDALGRDRELRRRRSLGNGLNACCASASDRESSVAPFTAKLNAKRLVTEPAAIHAAALQRERDVELASIRPSHSSWAAMPDPPKWFQYLGVHGSSRNSRWLH